MSRPEIIPPTAQDGSKLQYLKTHATRPVVVVFPAVPPIAIPFFVLNICASRSERIICSIPNFTAATTSGTLSSTAVDFTTLKFSGFKPVSCINSSKPFPS